jgi:hypothetical protein
MKLDSTYWKTELLPIADRIEQLSAFSHFSSRLANGIEREIMFAVFSIRTLIERCKLSEELLSRVIQVKAYPKKSAKPVTFLNSRDIEDLYDVNASVSKSVPLEFLCNQIIHSYILIPLKKERQFTDILVRSDYERNRWLYIVSIPFIVTLIREVASDSAPIMNITFNPKRQDYDIRISNRPK